MSLNSLFKAERAVIGAIITAASLIAIAFAVYFHFEGKFIEVKTAVAAHQQIQENSLAAYQQIQENSLAAHEKMQEQIELTGIRLNAKILEDRIAGLQQRIWVYQERYGPDCGAHRALCQQWQAEIRRLERQLRGIGR